jgi:hypothetical protein
VIRTLLQRHPILAGSLIGWCVARGFICTTTAPPSTCVASQASSDPAGQLALDRINALTEQLQDLRRSTTRQIDWCRRTTGALKMGVDVVISTWPWRGRARHPQPPHGWDWPAFGEHLDIN